MYTVTQGSFDPLGRPGAGGETAGGVGLRRRRPFAGSHTAPHRGLIVLSPQPVLARHNEGGASDRTRLRNGTFGEAMKAAILLPLCAAISSGAHAASPLPAGQDWQVAGRMGLLQFVVVAESRARDREFYNSIVKSLCEPDTTCFLRFFTNSKRAPVKLPLPDAILAEPTATFQRSAKQGNAVFQWSCRTGLAAGNCF